MRLEKVFCMTNIVTNALCLDDVGEKQFSVLFGYSFQSLNLMKGDGLFTLRIDKQKWSHGVH
jgi:hypothetical protein